MPWESTSPRRARLPGDWQARRLRILQRDGYACQHRDPSGRRCLRPANQVDHIVHGDDHSEANLQALCVRHHATKTAREGVEARIATGRQAPPPRRTYRDPEPHPGAYT